MLPVFRSGLGGRVGTGNQFWSWISLDDAVGAMHHALMESDIRGPLNVVSPQPVTNAQFTDELARALHRWAPIPLPGGVAKICLGEMADAFLCSSIRATPDKLCDTGYPFRDAALDHALPHMFGLARAPRK